MTETGKKYTRSVAVNMVIANMIGTGIFTSLGFQVLDGGIPDPFAILTIWVVGGIAALCGATAYAEIATTIRKSGGEYAFLSELYHPVLGFTSGWISMVAGFSAPIAGLALATGEYFIPMLGIDRHAVWDLGFTQFPVSKLIAVLVILLVVLVQLRGVRVGGMFQNYITYLKVALIAVFLIMPLVFIGQYEPSHVDFTPTADSWSMITSLPFAGALVWVMFSYSGWNASTYIAGSLENPKRNLPFSLLVGTLIVTVIYILLNFVFMYVATFDELAPSEARIDIGNVVAAKIMGEKVALIFSGVFSIALISGVSAMFIAGPKVIQEIGKDYKAFRVLGKETGDGAPKFAILLMCGVSLVLIFTSTFDAIIQYIGITLTFFSLLTVAGVFILRAKKKTNELTVKTWGYPVTPILFIALMGWMIAFFVMGNSDILWWSLASMAPGVIIYYATRKWSD